MTTVHKGDSGRKWGFTLTELLLVVVIIGIMLTMVTPRIATEQARRHVVGASAGFGALVRRARATAIQHRLPATITFASGRASVTIVRSGTTQVVGPVLDFTSEYGLTPAVSASTLRIEPTGLIVSGTPFTFIATKLSAADTVQITGYGRIE